MAIYSLPKIFTLTKDEAVLTGETECFPIPETGEHKSALGRGPESVDGEIQIRHLFGQRLHEVLDAFLAPRRNVDADCCQERVNHSWLGLPLSDFEVDRKFVDFAYDVDQVR